MTAAEPRRAGVFQRKCLALRVVRFDRLALALGLRPSTALSGCDLGLGLS